MADTIKTGKNPVIDVCKVLDVGDLNGGDRIKARIASDSTRKDSEIPWAFPLLPKIFHVKPKVGEAVIIITMDIDSNDSQRFYIGPIIPQATDINYAPINSVEGDALSFLQGAYTTPLPNPSMNPNAYGAIPENDDISIEGRKNCGIQITDDDVRIKAGVKKLNVNDKSIVFNRENPAYVRLKYDEKNGDYSSVAYVVADRIVLLGNKPSGDLQDFKSDNKTTHGEITGKNKFGKTRTKTILASERDLITDTEEENIMRTDNEDGEDRCTYRMVFGEPLIDFLTKFRDAFLNHTHPFPTMVPCNTDDLKELAEYDMEKNLLSNTTRLN